MEKELNNCGMIRLTGKTLENFIELRNLLREKCEGGMGQYVKLTNASAFKYAVEAGLEKLRK